MKETFTDNNYTQSDVAKSLFERHWMRSAFVNGNEEQHIVMRTSSMSGGGGMPYPGVSRMVYVEQTKETNDE